MEKSIKEKVIEYNQKYEENLANGIESNPNYMVIVGKKPILFSAPHAVMQVREGKQKIQDSMTGGIVEYLVREWDCFGITRTYNIGDDPNWDSNGPGLEYKKKIVELIKNNNIKYFFDIHAMSDKYGIDWCLGTGEFNNLNGDMELLEKIKVVLEENGKVSIDVPFKAANEFIVSNYVAVNSGIPAIQIEISQNMRFGKIEECIKTLEKIIGILSN